MVRKAMKRSPESPKPERIDTATEKAPQQEGFLNRWSQRKRDSSIVTVEGEQQDTADVALEESLPEAVEVEEAKPILTDADMPDIETLNADSDFSPFFSEGVSKDLRKLALKKLFFSGKFSARDGLDDYDDDFTNFEPLGDTVTSDMKFHRRRKEKARLEKLEAEKLEAEKLKAAELEDAANKEQPEQQLESEKSENNSSTEDNLTEDKGLPPQEQIESPPPDTVRHAGSNAPLTEDIESIDDPDLG